MRVTHAEVHRVTLPAPQPAFSWRKGLLGSGSDGDGAVLRLGTDEGVEGVALVSHPGAYAALSPLVDRVLREELVGQDPLQREWLWHRVWEIDRTEELPLWLLGTVDTALWDLAGRHAGLPSWQVMGGFRTSIPAYASTTTFGSVEQFLSVADQCLYGVRASAKLRGGITGALRTAHLADAFRVRAEVHSPEIPSRHLCMAISNTTYFESIVTSDPVRRPDEITADGMLLAPTGPGISLPGNLDLPSPLQPYAEVA